MRQLSPTSNLLLACLGAFGLVGTLGLPWYAAPVKDHNIYDGPIEKGAFQVAKVFSHSASATTGNAAAGGAKVLVIALAAVIVVLAAIGTSQDARAKVRDALRAVALIVLPVLAYLAIRHPGVTDGVLRIHWGMLVAFAVALVTLSAAWQGGEVRVKRGPSGTWAQPQAQRR